MRNNFSQAIQLFFTPETILPFFLGSILLAILGNTIYDLLKNTLGSETPVLLGIGAVSLLLLIFFVSVAVILLNYRLDRLRRNPIEIGKRKPQPTRGLILMVSNLEACQKAIAYHQPQLQRCWLLCSTATQERARALADEFSELCPGEPLVINDVYDPLEFRDVINSIYQNLPRAGAPPR